MEGLVPEGVLWRRKEAFSDGVSSQERSWFQVIREHVDRELGPMTEEELAKACDAYPDPKPYDKESLYYRRIFCELFPGRDSLVPYYWRHPFCWCTAGKRSSKCNSTIHTQPTTWS